MSNRKNVRSISFEKEPFEGIGSIEDAAFYLGCPKVLSLQHNFEDVYCGENLFIFAEQLLSTKHDLNFCTTEEVKTINVYAPFLKQISMVCLRNSYYGKRFNVNMYCPCLQHGNGGNALGKPATLYTSSDANIGAWNWFRMHHYKDKQLEKIEKAKKALLDYIEANPELSTVSLNCPKPESEEISQEKWDKLVALKEYLMALMRGENPQAVR